MELLYRSVFLVFTSTFNKYTVKDMPSISQEIYLTLSTCFSLIAANSGLDAVPAPLHRSVRSKTALQVLHPFID